MENIKKFKKVFTEDGDKKCIIVEASLNDNMKEPYFSLTASVYNNETFNTNDKYFDRAGTLDDDIANLFPELKKYLKWHLTSTKSPSHYIGNTTYFAMNGELEKARNAAKSPKATLKQLKNINWLEKRLPAIMEEFKKDMTELGLWKPKFDTLNEIKKENVQESGLSL